MMKTRKQKTANITVVKWFIVGGLETKHPTIVDASLSYSEAERLRRRHQIDFDCLATLETGRIITNEELFNLPEEWENSKVDTSKYTEAVLEAWEVSNLLYRLALAAGDLCQKHEGKYYLA